jgi:hypothetical protein
MPPVVIAGGIAAAGAIGGAVLSSSAQKKAANTAATAETNAANSNIAAAREFQQQNQGNLQPFLNSGYQGNALIDSFLYGNGSQGGSAPGARTGFPCRPAEPHRLGQRGAQRHRRTVRRRPDLDSSGRDSASQSATATGMGQLSHQQS